MGSGRGGDGRCRHGGAASVPPHGWHAGRRAGALALMVISSGLVLRFMPVGPLTNDQQLAQAPPTGQGQDRLLPRQRRVRCLVPARCARSCSPVRWVAVPAGEGADLPPDSDFDTTYVGSLDQVDAVIGTTDPSGSEPPPNFRLVATSGPFGLWERTGSGEIRGTLSNEHGQPGQLFDCQSAEGKAVLSGGGTAGIRMPPVYVSVPPLKAGQAVSVPATLKPGRWDIGLAYGWRDKVRVMAPGVRRTLPATLDRQGQFFPVGRTTVRAAGPTTIRVQAEKPRWNSPASSSGPPTWRSRRSAPSGRCRSSRRAASIWTGTSPRAAERGAQRRASWSSSAMPPARRGRCSSARSSVTSGAGGWRICGGTRNIEPGG